MRVRLTTHAIRQVDSALAYVAASSPQGAAHIGLRLYQLLGVLADRPGIGRKTNGPGLRRLAKPFPYIIEYRIVGDEIRGFSFATPPDEISPGVFSSSPRRMI